MCRGIGLIIGIIQIMLSVLIIADLSSAETYIVDDDGGGWADFTSIQDAVDASSDGDVILVFSGTYEEQVRVNKTVSIIGNGSAETTVTGNGSIGHVVTINADSVNLTGLKVTGSGQIHPYAGIFLNGVNDTAIRALNVTGNYLGILLVSSRRNDISDNELHSNINSAVELQDGSSNNSISWNRASGDALTDLTDSNGTIIHNNTFIFTDVGTAITVSWSSYCVIDNNTLINRSKFDGQAFGIHVKFHSSNVTIKGNDISFFDYGIDLSAPDSNAHTLRDNVISGCAFGISVLGSDNNVIETNSISKCTVGIRFYDAENNLVSTNDISDNSFGMVLTGVDVDEVTRYNVFSNNTISNNTECGIDCIFAANNSFLHNEIFNNGDLGMRFSSLCSDNDVFENNFANNGNGSSQAIDNGTANVWDTGSVGNYWSDWSGSGAYEIGGSAGAEDRYPLADPSETNAPRKVPEVAFLMTLIMIVTSIHLARRK
ncbi:MAG: pectinesterase family protein [Thermoplasmata archaeon]|nr:pectinesterase family protein [Thermoplasmata archaeon]